MSKIFLADRSDDFAMDNECEKSRMKEATNELATLVSSLTLKSEEMPIEEYVKLPRDKIVDAMFNTAKLANLKGGREIHLGLDLNEEPM